MPGSTHLLSIDGGISTGASLWSLPDISHAQLEGAWQFTGGLRGFMAWTSEHRIADAASEGLTVLSEKFTPLNNKGFSLTMESVEPLRIEGAMVALGMIPDYEPGSPNWQRPAAMYWAGGSNLAERKKRARKWLKDHDLLVPAKELGAPDNNDFVSSSLHALAWLRKHHKPTLEHYWPNEEEQVD